MISAVISLVSFETMVNRLLGSLEGEVALTEKIIWSTPSDLAEVETLQVENNGRPWRVYHDTYAICNMDDFINENRLPCPGMAEWTYRRRLHHNPARTLMLIEPGEVHQNTKTPPPCDFSVLFISPKLVNDVASEEGMGSNPHFKSAVASTPSLYRAFVRFHAALREHTTLLHRESLLVDCIGSLLSGYCEKTPYPVLHPGRLHLDRARDFLEQHFSENISVTQLAKISGLSRYHFQRTFAKQYGLPPHRYQINLRIEKVHQLLKSGVPIDLIEAGFADQSHLIRNFKDAMGVTPGKYAAMVKPARIDS